MTPPPPRPTNPLTAEDAAAALADAGLAYSYDEARRDVEAARAEVSAEAAVGGEPIDGPVQEPTMTDPKILYRQYLLGRLAAVGGDPRELSLDELAARSLGRGDLHRDSSLRSAAQVAADVVELMPKQTEAPATTTSPPLVTVGSTVRLPPAGMPMTVARVITHDEDGRITATLDLRPCADFAPAPSPWRAEPTPEPTAGV